MKAILTGLLLAGLFLAGCSGQKTPETADTAPADTAEVRVTLSPAQYEVAGIAIGNATLRPLNTSLKINGILDLPAENRVSVSVPLGGYIRQIRLEPGMPVKKGQTLVVLENPEYIQLQQDYLDTKAKTDYIELEYARQLDLSKANVSALRDLQQVRSNRQSLLAQLAGLRQRLALIGIDADKLDATRLTRTITVSAPVSGFITSVPANNGRFVNPTDIIAEIAEMSRVYVKLTVFEKDIPVIRTGQSVQFGVGAESSATHSGTVFLIGKSLEADRTVSVLVRPAAVSADFIPGSYVTAQVRVGIRNTLAVPETAVAAFGGKSYVYTAEGKSGAAYRFRQVEVTPGVRDGGYVAIQLPDGLDPARTPLVLKGAYALLSALNNASEE
jgi:cobalt-zinc-cadmium efflux system membrane fusion protein